MQSRDSSARRREPAAGAGVGESEAGARRREAPSPKAVTAAAKKGVEKRPAVRRGEQYDKENNLIENRKPPSSASVNRPPDVVNVAKQQFASGKGDALDGDIDCTNEISEINERLVSLQKFLNSAQHA